MSEIVNEIIYLEFGLKTSHVTIPDILDMIPYCCPVWNIRILELAPQQHKNTAQMRVLNHIQ